MPHVIMRGRHSLSGDHRLKMLGNIGDKPGVRSNAQIIIVGSIS